MIKVLSTIITILLIAVITQLYLNSKVNDELNQANFQIDTLEYRVDSIKGELFIKEMELDKCKDLQKITNVEH
jgi:hypothetical protein